MPPQVKKRAFFPQHPKPCKINTMLGRNFAKNKPDPMPPKTPKPPEPAAGWLENLPTETKTQLSALCRHYGQEFKEDLPQIIAAYYDAKRRAKQRITTN
jgi:hypothetical protein